MSRGGARKGSGRKRGTGLSNFIRNRVDEMLFELLSNEEFKSKAKAEVNNHEMFRGWIYIIRNNINGQFKVGITQGDNPNVRLSLYTAHGMDVELIFIENIDNCRELEDFIHSNISEFFVGKSDWCELNHEDVLSIIKIINHYKYPKYGRR